MNVVQLIAFLFVCLAASQVAGGVSHESDTTTLLAQARFTLEFFKDTVPSRCIHEADHKLGQLPETTFDDFVHCPNASDALKNLQQMVCNTLDYGADVFRNFSCVLLGVNKCLPLTTEENVKCLTQYLWTVYDTLYTLVDDGKKYAKTMMKLGEKVKADFDACLHPGNKTIEIQIDHVMNDFVYCALA